MAKMGQKWHRERFLFARLAALIKTSGTLTEKIVIESEKRGGSQNEARIIERPNGRADR